MNQHEGLEAAQKSSVEHHFLATSLNAVGLGLGIFLVFFMAAWGEWYITLGMIFVLLSIVAYVGFEWLAKCDDRKIVQLQEKNRIEEIAREERLIRLHPSTETKPDGTKGNFPNTLRLRDGYIEMTYEPIDKRDALQ